jgi:hypothetical protein
MLTLLMAVQDCGHFRIFDHEFGKEGSLMKYESDDISRFTITISDHLSGHFSIIDPQNSQTYEFGYFQVGKFKKVKFISTSFTCPRGENKSL